MIKKKRIIFRADGGPGIGMGHFIRTLALAEMLNEHFQCIFATCKPTDYQIQEIEKICHSRIDLPEDDSHFSEFLIFLKGDEIVVLDNYYFTTEYQKAIKAKGCKLVCIDDMHDKHYVADIVINHAPLISDLFSTAIYTRLLIGFDYALLRNCFLQNQDDNAVFFKLNKAFLCIGGADFNNLTPKILDDLVEIKQIEAITIVVGNAYQLYENLEKKVTGYSQRKQIKLLKNLSADELIIEMKQSDFAIVPCSTILMETISQKLPILTGYYVDNQKEIAKYLKNKYSKISVLGDLNEVKIQQYHLSNIENNLDQPYFPSINRNVKEMLLNVFHSLSIESNIKYRKAEINDIDIYFLWANNIDVRKNAINQEKIKYENHVKWFKSKINNENSFLYLFEKGDTSIGQVRFDKSDSNYIVDYSVDEKFRGQGYSKVILKLGLEQLLKDIKNNKQYKIKAIVKVDNKASSKVFESFNFSNNGVIEINGDLYVEFEKEVL